MCGITAVVLNWCSNSFLATAMFILLFQFNCNGIFVFFLLLRFKVAVPFDSNCLQLLIPIVSEFTCPHFRYCSR
ncbi:hypothetical protein MtrunA17_Chr8g0375911 [Medicago truncatula]|uniref:Transmembrane protein n=1 Tax=Medicago truncatula TaxID=3880 RepID=A0A396GPL6_MEDTR|nr:hypothetical protein MtrunA17_Chr8g0375911 [Medicago truncatula]